MHDFVHQPDLPTLLLIDDDMVSREVMATVLTMSGYTVHTADSGEASIALLEGGGCIPAAILMDAQMPGLSGAELIAQLRAHSTASVVAISASAVPDDVAAACDGFLLKPFGAEAVGKFFAGQLHPAKPTSTAASDPASLIPPKRSEPLLDPTVPVVKAETLAQLRDMMPESAVKQIYEAIVADLYKRLGLLQAAIAKDDAAEVRRIGHSIKGGCGMAGALQAARIGTLLQAGALELPANPGRNQLDNSSEVLTDLRIAAGNLESMLEQEFPA
jgi:CheY-like chemotaxis protein